MLDYLKDPYRLATHLRWYEKVALTVVFGVAFSLADGLANVPIRVH